MAIPALAGWTFAESDIREALRGDRLLNPSIDLGVICDLNCPYCFTEDRSGPRRVRRELEMTRGQVFDVLEDLVTAGARSVNIVGAGEPLLSGWFRDVVDFLWTRDVTPILFTNGTRVADDPELVKFLAARAATVVVKMNSKDPTLQDAVAGRRGYTARRDAAVDALVAAGMTSVTPTRLGVDTLAFSGNIEELPSIHRWCRERNIYPLTSDFIPTGRTKCGGVPVGLSDNSAGVELAEIAARALQPLSMLQRSELRARLAAVDREMGIQIASTNAYYGGGFCTQILGVYVDVEGAIWPCVARSQIIGPVDQPLGNVREGAKASDVWRESPYMKFIRSTYDGGCPYKSPCVAVRGDLEEVRTRVS